MLWLELLSIILLDYYYYNTIIVKVPAFAVRPKIQLIIIPVITYSYTKIVL